MSSPLPAPPSLGMETKLETCWHRIPQHCAKDKAAISGAAHLGYGSHPERTI